MNRINESYLAKLIDDLHYDENELFTKMNQPKQHGDNKHLNDPKLEKLKERKTKLISQLKYNATALKSLLDNIEYQIKNPKIKIVGV